LWIQVIREAMGSLKVKIRFNGPSESLLYNEQFAPFMAVFR